MRHRLERYLWFMHEYIALFLRVCIGLAVITASSLVVNKGVYEKWKGFLQVEEYVGLWMRHAN